MTNHTELVKRLREGCSILYSTDIPGITCDHEADEKLMTEAAAALEQQAEQIEKLRGRCERFCTICSGHYFTRDPGCPWCAIDQMAEQIAELNVEIVRQKMHPTQRADFDQMREQIARLEKPLHVKVGVQELKCDRDKIPFYVEQMMYQIAKLEAERDRLALMLEGAQQIAAALDREQVDDT
jgi:hypothetical protein